MVGLREVGRGAGCEAKKGEAFFVLRADVSNWQRKGKRGDGGHRWILCLTPASVNLSSICVGRQERRVREGVRGWRCVCVCGGGVTLLSHQSNWFIFLVFCGACCQHERERAENFGDSAPLPAGGLHSWPAA